MYAKHIENKDHMQFLQGSNKLGCKGCWWKLWEHLNIKFIKFIHFVLIETVRID